MGGVQRVVPRTDKPHPRHFFDFGGRTAALVETAVEHRRVSLCACPPRPSILPLCRYQGAALLRVEMRIGPKRHLIVSNFT